MYPYLAFLLAVLFIGFDQADRRSTPTFNRGPASASLLEVQKEALAARLRTRGEAVFFDDKAFHDLARAENLGQFETHGTFFAEFDDTHPDKRRHKLRAFIRERHNVMVPVEVLNQDLSSLLGKEVTFRGVEDTGDPVGHVRAVSAAVMPQTPEEFSVNHKMLILLFRFKNSTRTFTTAKEVEDAVFNGAYQDFFLHMSDNKVHHSGKVFGFYYLDRNGDDDGGSSMPCDVSQAEIIQAAAFYKVNLREYDQVTTVSNCSEYHTIGGRAVLSAFDFLNIGKNQSYIKMASRPDILDMKLTNPRVPGWSPFISILVHERGHNFGLVHSNRLHCGTSPILHPCGHVEYGNDFDRMGSADGSYLFNGHQQKLAGFKGDNDFLHIKRSGYYSIDKITSKRKGRKIGAYIYNPLDQEQSLFFLEYRTPEGLDNNLNQWLFRDVPQGGLLYTRYSPSTELTTTTVQSSFNIVNAHPTAPGPLYDNAYGALRGEFFDARSGTKITTYEGSLGKLEFRVDFNPQDSICGKTGLADWVSAPYIKLSSTSGSGSSTGTSRTPVRPDVVIGGSTPFNGVDVRKTHIVLVPGDQFQLKIDTLFGDPLICSRTEFEVSIMNSQSMGPYFMSPLNQNHFLRITTNNNRDIAFPVLRVPVAELNRDRVVTYQIKNRVTGETITRNLNLYVRSSHNSPIRLPATR